jgi:xanthine dehydrogenase accessory factor
MTAASDHRNQPGLSGAESANDLDAVYHRLSLMADTGEEGVLATVVVTRLSTPRRAGAKMIIHRDGSLTGTVGGGSAEALVITTAAEVLDTGECRLLPIDLTGTHGVCGGTMEIFLEPVQRAVPFVVIGAGHVGQAVATLGRTLSFRFTLVDDRPALLAAAAAGLPGVRTILADPTTLAEHLSVPRRGAVLVCSRNHKLDAAYLEALLRLELSTGREFQFFGSLGSRAKAARLRHLLSAQPEFASRLPQVRLPVGLALGAESPAEIALSILAEAQAVLRGIAPVQLPDGTLAYRVQGETA